MDIKELHDNHGSWGIVWHCQTYDKIFSDWIANQELWRWHWHVGVSGHLSEQKYYMRSKGKKIWKRYQGKKLTTLIDSLMPRLWNKASEEGYEGHSFWIWPGKRWCGEVLLEEAMKTLGREDICERISAKRIKYQHRQLQSDSLSNCSKERTKEQWHLHFGKEWKRHRTWSN